MGIVIRQSFKQVLVNYFGIALGALSTLFIYPLDLESYGIILFLISTTDLMLPIVTSGIFTIAIRYFPEFNKIDDQKNYLLPFIWFLGTVSMILFFLFLSLVKSYFIEPLANFGFDVGNLSEYENVIWILVIIVFYNTTIINYINNYKRIVVPALFTNILQKITLPLLILAKLYYGFSSGFIVIGYLIYQVFSGLGLSIYLRTLGGLNLAWKSALLTKKRLSSFLDYSVSNALTYIGSAMTTKIDHFMISTILNFQKSGAYAISQFVGNVIDMPAKSLLNITNPIISQNMAAGNMDEIKKIYHRSSLNLLILGVFLSLIIWSVLPILFSLTQKLQALWPGAQYIVLIIIAAKLVNMMTSVNHQIISHSKFYRFNLWSMISLGGMNIGLNIYFMPKYGILGAAIASFISLTCINIVKVIFIIAKFNLAPLPRSVVKLIPIVVLNILIWYFSKGIVNDFIHGICC
ncbi:MAG: polysaccharide biosynthesis C-terminal domain-containing protein, partial [Flavobacteriales bacterium]|nr:polysaccharide biosynthesis C-terminal domain-containing protein [Flavobacteriales bacterium]